MLSLGQLQLNPPGELLEMVLNPGLWVIPLEGRESCGIYKTTTVSYWLRAAGVEGIKEGTPWHFLPAAHVPRENSSVKEMQVQAGGSQACAEGVRGCGQE